MFSKYFFCLPKQKPEYQRQRPIVHTQKGKGRSNSWLGRRCRLWRIRANRGAIQIVESCQWVPRSKVEQLREGRHGYQRLQSSWSISSCSSYIHWTLIKLTVQLASSLSSSRSAESIENPKRWRLPTRTSHEKRWERSRHREHDQHRSRPIPWIRCERHAALSQHSVGQPKSRSATIKEPRPEDAYRSQRPKIQSKEHEVQPDEIASITRSSDSKESQVQWPPKAVTGVRSPAVEFPSCIWWVLYIESQQDQDWKPSFLTPSQCLKHRALTEDKYIISKQNDGHSWLHFRNDERPQPNLHSSSIDNDKHEQSFAAPIHHRLHTGTSRWSKPASCQEVQSCSSPQLLCQPWRFWCTRSSWR